MPTITETGENLNNPEIVKLVTSSEPLYRKVTSSYPNEKEVDNSGCCGVK